jgi:hypothetical protein
MAMKYMLMVFTDDTRFQQMSEAERAKAIEPYRAYMEAMKNAGIYKGGDRLRPAEMATTVRVANGKTEVLNGPYVETKEQLGGYFLIDVPDIDAALSWASRCPGVSHGIVEVRPIWANE